MANRLVCIAILGLGVGVLGCGGGGGGDGVKSQSRYPGTKYVQNTGKSKAQSPPKRAQPASVAKASTTKKTDTKVEKKVVAKKHDPTKTYPDFNDTNVQENADGMVNRVRN